MMSTPGRLRVAALAAWLAAGAIGCRTVTDPDPDPYGPVSNPPWTIGGARPGMTPDEVERLLGPPTKSETKYQRTTSWWGEISVTFDAGGRAVEVFGDRVTGADRQTIVQRGVSEAEVVGRLGEGKLQSSYQSSSSGVIACGRRRTGGERTYQDATARYTVGVYEDRMSFARIQPR